MTTWWMSTASVLTAVVVSELLESQSSVHLDTESALHHHLPLRTNLLKSATTMPAVMGSMMLIILLECRNVSSGGGGSSTLTRVDC